jgi:hypothetical protein
MPFIHPEFLDKRPLAELYNSQLDLCKAVWEAIDITKDYSTPYDWWKDCMIELQKAQLDSILASGGSERTTLLKGQTEDGLRKFIKDLKNDNIPFKQSTKSQHLFRLYFSAIKMKTKDSNIKNAWENYLSKLRLYAKALKDNSDLKMIVHLGGTLYYQGEKNHLVRI